MAWWIFELGRGGKLSSVGMVRPDVSASVNLQGHLARVEVQVDPKTGEPCLVDRRAADLGGENNRNIRRMNIVQDFSLLSLPSEKRVDAIYFPDEIT